MSEFKVPTSIKNIAIIMDGNGRWAQERRRPRVWGHTRGSFVVSRIVEKADDMGVESLTIYAFSTENWKRPISEIKVLFSLLKKFVVRERARILKNNIRFRVIGDISSLPEETKNLVISLEKDSALNTGLKFNVAFGYGGQDEIVKAVNRFMMQNPGKPITESDISKNLYLEDLSELDVLIRTGGDQRISNFLLWQAAYAELYFTDVKWPEFSDEIFENILEEISTRERRYGGLLENNSNTLNFQRKPDQIDQNL